MNASGEAVQRARRDLRLDPEEFIVVYDDLDLPVGRVRVRKESGAGGHRGVSSIIEALGSKAFPRVRVGIGRPPGGDAVDYVLESPRGDEAAAIRDSVDVAADAVETIVRDGVGPAMNRFNGKAG
jgi:peptidyl-tRNA hydrolase, PTH1 family